MNIESKLKDLILTEYGTMRDFARAAGIPQTTLVGIMSRGVKNSNVGNIIKICKTLGISADELSKGRVTPIDESGGNGGRQLEELGELLQAVAVRVAVFESVSVNGSPLTADDVKTVSDALEALYLLIRHRHGMGDGR